jgi:hypothetical protein
MTFFQNVFTSDFEGNWVLGDRQHTPKFVVRRNFGRGDEVVSAWTEGPYNFSGNDADGNSCDTLEIVYALMNPRNWATLAITTTTGAANTAAVTPEELVASLNANTTFAERFVAFLGIFPSGSRRVEIRQKKPITEFRFYINNGRAEEKVRFNARAGVAELPTYFDRHTIANRFTHEDNQNHLIALDPAGNTVDANLIDAAVDSKGMSLGYDSSTVQEDWALLEGRSGLFQFQNGPSTNAVDSTETVIIYPAGAIAGDLAKKIVTKKDAAGAIIQIAEMPYTLTGSDLITP